MMRRMMSAAGTPFHWSFRQPGETARGGQPRGDRVCPGRIARTSRDIQTYRRTDSHACDHRTQVLYTTHPAKMEENTVVEPGANVANANQPVHIHAVMIHPAQDPDKTQQARHSAQYTCHA
jgi:hypothetical protein